MIKVTTIKETLKISNDFVRQYIENLLNYLLKEYQEYCTDGSISSIGAIFYVEENIELEQFYNFGISTSIIELEFEWMEDIGNGYINGCVVIDNDKAINIIGKNHFFAKYVED